MAVNKKSEFLQTKSLDFDAQSKRKLSLFICMHKNEHFSISQSTKHKYSSTHHQIPFAIIDIELLFDQNIFENKIKENK